eukprot:SAG31_NODE_362_length_16904_cov_7.893218_14_plen_98_part_00
MACSTALTILDIVFTLRRRVAVRISWCFWQLRVPRKGALRGQLRPTLTGCSMFCHLVCRVRICLICSSLWQRLRCYPHSVESAQVPSMLTSLCLCRC